jgi:hypothetical protein
MCFLMNSDETGSPIHSLKLSVMKLQLLLYTLIAGFLLLSSSLLAQHAVSGTVSDEEGAPLIGVTVLEAETSQWHCHRCRG